MYEVYGNRDLKLKENGKLILLLLKFFSGIKRISKRISEK